MKSYISIERKLYKRTVAIYHGEIESKTKNVSIKFLRTLKHIKYPPLKAVLDSFSVAIVDSCS